MLENDSTQNCGGGIYGAYGSNPTIKNNVIRRNIAVRGGGGLSFGHRAGGIVVNNTVYGNWGGSGGGLYCYDTSSPSVTNCIFWENCADSLQEISVESGSPVLSFCDIRGGFAGAGNIDSNPAFADSAAGDFRLTWAHFPVEDSTKSPCIDTGDPSSPPDSDGTRADMGALPFDRRLLGLDDDRDNSSHSALRTNYPNPFNTRTTIRFSLPEAEHIVLNIYDILGRRIGTPFSGALPAGRHNLIWDAGESPSGIYFYRLTAEGRAISGKMTLLK